MVTKIFSYYSEIPNRSRKEYITQNKGLIKICTFVTLLMLPFENYKKK